MTNWAMWYHLSETDWYSRIGMVYPVVWGIVFFWIFAFGACWGSFLNVCIWRIPRGESLSKAASHCTSCGAPIHWYDNLPVISFLVLHGKCRQCGQSYSPSYFFVELFCGIFFVLTVLKTGFFRQTPAVLPAHFAMIFFAAGCALIDIRHRVIPDKMNYSAMVCGILCALLLPQMWGGISRLYALFWCLLSGVVPAVILAAFAFSGKMICKKTVIGMGDVKFIMATGMLIGLPGAVFALLAGAISGCAIGVILKKKLDAAIAFGPFLASGALFWVFAGNTLLDIYYKICTIMQ